MNRPRDVERSGTLATAGCPWLALDLLGARVDQRVVFQSIIMSISVRRVRKTHYQSTSWEHDDVPFTRSTFQACQATTPGRLFHGRMSACSKAYHARRDHMVWHTYALPRSQVRKPLTLDPARSRQRTPLWWPRSGITGRLPISSRQDQRLSAFKSSLLPRERVRELQRPCQ